MPVPHRAAPLILLLTLQCPCRADTISVAPASDATLYQSADGSIASGSGEQLFTGRTLRSGSQRIALVRFDLSAIPRGSIVHAATFSVFVSRNNSGGGTIELFECLASWGEGPSAAIDPGGAGTDAAPGDATWLHRFYPSVLWSHPGGDIDDRPIDSAPIPLQGTGPVTWSSPSLLPLIQRWVNEPASNFGWAIGSTSRDVNSARRLGSRENTVPQQRPLLVVSFSLCPLSCCLADFNDDGSRDPDDLGDFITCFFDAVPCPRADFNADGRADPDDLADFITSYFTPGC